MTTRRPDLLAMIHELTEPTQNREQYMRKRKPRYHVTSNPPLLAQLDESALPSNTRIDGAGTIAGSRPAANVDAIDTANRIRDDATWWLRYLGADDTGELIDLVHRLAPFANGNNIHPDHARRLGFDIRCWWTWARITTGWDQPPWQPNNTCPACATRGSIRIRLHEHLATCTNDNCRATWDHDTIGLLAEHIRTENGEAQAS